MRLYPDVPSRRLAVLARDAVAIALIALFAWAGVEVHHAVDRLAGVGATVRETGESVRRSFDDAADKVDDVPAIGGSVADALRGAGDETGGEVAAAGKRGEDAAHRLADLLGWLTFGIPSSLVLLWWLPRRIAETRALTEAARVLDQPASPERRRAIAMRAAFSLPYGTLLQHTRDPLGDLAAERYDPLVAAALEDAGLRARH